MAREVTGGEETAWSCVEAYAGLWEDGKSEAARVEDTDRFRVVCTSGGGAQAITVWHWLFLPTRHRLEIHGLRGDCRAAGVPVKYQGLNCPAIDFTS